MNLNTLKRDHFLAIYRLLLIVCVFLNKNRLGYIGLAYFFGTLLVFELFFNLMARGVALYVGRFMKNKTNRGLLRSANLVKFYTFTLMIIAGIIGSILLGFFSYRLSLSIYLFEYAQFLGIFLIPAFLFRCVNEYQCGILCGRGNDLMYNFSYIIRGVLYCIFSCLGSVILENYGLKVSTLLLVDNFKNVYACIGLFAGICISEFLLIIIYFVFLRILNKKTPEYEKDSYKIKDNLRTIFVSLYSARAMDILNYTAMAIVGIVFIYIGAHFAVPGVEYAEYLGKLLIGPIFISFILGTISEFIMVKNVSKTNYQLSHDDYRRARGNFHMCLHVTAVLAMLGSIYMASLSELLGSFVNISADVTFNKMIFTGAFVCFFASLAMFLYKILYSQGYGEWTAICIFVGGIAGSAVAIFSGNKGVGVIAILYGLITLFAVITIGLILCSFYLLNLVTEPISEIAIPVIVGLVVGVINIFLSRFFAPHLGSVFTVIFCIIEMTFVYIILLIVLRNITEGEANSFPGGRFITAIGQMLHVL